MADRSAHCRCDDDNLCVMALHVYINSVRECECCACGSDFAVKVAHSACVPHLDMHHGCHSIGDFVDVCVNSTR